VKRGRPVGVCGGENPRPPLSEGSEKKPKKTDSCKEGQLLPKRKKTCGQEERSTMDGKRMNLKVKKHFLKRSQGESGDGTGQSNEGLRGCMQGGCGERFLKM